MVYSYISFLFYCRVVTTFQMPNRFLLSDAFLQVYDVSNQMYIKYQLTLAFNNMNCMYTVVW